MITPDKARGKTQRSKDEFVKTFETNNSLLVKSIETAILEGISFRNKYTIMDISDMTTPTKDDIKDFLNYKGFTSEEDIHTKQLFIRWL